MDRFTVTAIMRAPMVLNGGFLTLDALLAGLAYMRTGDARRAEAEVPLRQTDGLFHASAAIMDPLARRPVSIVASLHARHKLDPALLKRNPEGAIHRRIGLENRQKFGLVLNTYLLVETDEVTWYAEGDRDAVMAELEAQPVFLGSRRAGGYGEVEKWEIDEGDFDGITGPVGEPLRPVPVDVFGGDRSGVRKDCAWRPPYWHPANRAVCFAPKALR